MSETSVCLILSGWKPEEIVYFYNKGYNLENLFMPYANIKGADQPAHQQRRRSACASAQSDLRLCCSLPTSTWLSRNFKTLASLISSAGRFESYSVPGRKTQKQVLSWRDSFICLASYPPTAELFIEVILAKIQNNQNKISFIHSCCEQPLIILICL